MKNTTLSSVLKDILYNDEYILYIIDSTNWN